MTKRINEIKQLLIDDIKQTARKRGLMQRDLCQKFGEAPPRMSRMYAGKVDEFSLNLLIKWVYALGRRVVVRVTK